MIVLNAGDYLQAKTSASITGGILTVTLNAGGTGYTPGTVTLTVAGGTGGTLSATASAGGIITSIDSISAYGTGYSVANAVSTTAGAGSGCTVNVNAIYQPSYSVSFIDTVDDLPGQQSGFLNGTTAVTIVSSPSTGKRIVDFGIIFNADKASVIPIIELVSSGGTVEIIPRKTIAINNSLEFGRQSVSTVNIDDTAVSGATTSAISSNWAYNLNTLALTLLSSTTVSLAADGDTTLYTVPSGKTCVLAWAVLIAGADTGSTTVSIGQSGATTDWIPNNTLATSIANDAFILQPVPNLTTPVKKAYAAGTVIKATVGSHAGGASNTLKLFGFLY